MFGADANLNPSKLRVQPLQKGAFHFDNVKVEDAHFKLAPRFKVAASLYALLGLLRDSIPPPTKEMKEENEDAATLLLLKERQFLGWPNYGYKHCGVQKDNSIIALLMAKNWDCCLHLAHDSASSSQLVVERHFHGHEDCLWHYFLKHFI